MMSIQTHCSSPSAGRAEPRPAAPLAEGPGHPADALDARAPRGQGGAVSQARLPAQLAAAICAHRLPRTAVSRVLGARLGAAAATDAGAADAARNLLRRVQRLIDVALPEERNWSVQLAAFAADGCTPRASRTGDIGADDVPEALLGPDVRVLLNMVRNVEGLAAVALQRLAEGLVHAAPGAAERVRRAGVDADLVVARYGRLDAERRKRPNKFLEALADEPLDAMHAMRRATPWRSAAPMDRGDDAARLPRPTAAERRQRAAAGHASGPPRIERGTQLFAPVVEHPWHRQALANEMYTAVSMSGTTDRLLWLDSMLGSTRAQAEALVLAIIGHLVPDHHSYHEVMAAAQAHGLAYEPSPAWLRGACHALLARPPGAHPDAAAAREQLRVALAETLDRGTGALGVLPADLLDRIVGACGAAAIPHLLLTSPALSQLAGAPRAASLGRLAAALARSQGREATLALLASPSAHRLLAEVTRLDLGWRGLMACDVDAVVSRCPRLTYLDLRGNPLGQWPASLAAHPCLRRLYLPATGLARLPPLSLPALRSLDVSHNSVLAELPASLAASCQLEALALVGTAVCDLPPGLGGRQGLVVRSSAAP